MTINRLGEESVDGLWFLFFKVQFVPTLLSWAFNKHIAHSRFDSKAIGLYTFS